MRTRVSASLAVLGSLAALACSPPCADDEHPHAAGELVWELLLEGRDDDAVADLAVDACAGVVATGRLWTNAWVDGGNHSNLWLARVSFDGDPVWQLERDHRFDDLGTGVAIAPEGALISIGNSDSGPYPGSSTVAGWLAYHELDGRERWRVREEVQDRSSSSPTSRLTPTRSSWRAGCGATIRARSSTPTITRASACGVTSTASAVGFDSCCCSAMTSC
jgi:hypothetical protein